MLDNNFMIDNNGEAYHATEDNKTTPKKKRNRSPAVAKSVKAREEIWKHQNNGNYYAPCQISWCTTTVSAHSGWDASHFISRAAGGDDSIANMRVCCTKCNQCMHTRSVQEWEETHWAGQPALATPVQVSPKATRLAVQQFLLAKAQELTTVAWEFSMADFGTLVAEIQQKKGVKMTEGQLANSLGRLEKSVDYLCKTRGVFNPITQKATTVWAVLPLCTAIVKTLQNVAHNGD